MVSFQCRAEKFGLCSSLCGYGVCQGKQFFITPFSRNTAWVAKRNCQELSQGCPCLFPNDGGTSSSSSHIVSLSSVLCVCVCASLCVPSPVHTCKVGFYAPTEVSLKLLLALQKAGTGSWLNYSHPPPIVCLFVCLSFFPGVGTDKITAWNFQIVFFLLEFVNLPANNQGEDQFIPM